MNLRRDDGGGVLNLTRMTQTDGGDQDWSHNQDMRNAWELVGMVVLSCLALGMVLLSWEPHYDAPEWVMYRQAIPPPWTPLRIILKLAELLCFGGVWLLAFRSAVHFVKRSDM
jgi:hypothetical protein